MVNRFFGSLERNQRLGVNKLPLDTKPLPQYTVSLQYIVTPNQLVFNLHEAFETPPMTN